MRIICVGLFAAMLAGCLLKSGGGSGPGDGDDGDQQEEYENHVYFSCNGSVLADRTFTRRSECEAFKESFGIQYCNGTKFQVSC